MTCRLKRILLLIVITICLAQPSKSQSYYFRHYQVENGLSNNTVGCSLQDRRGFLWFGTKDGLNRFDGYSFKVFQYDRDDPRSIGSNFIISLFEDKQGVIWVGTDRGLFIYNASQENFSLVRALPSDEIRAIQMDNSGVLWVVVRSRLFRYNVKTGKCRPYSKLKNYGITSICMTRDGILWMSATSGTLVKINPNRDAVVTHDLFNKTEHSTSRWIQKVYDAGNGLLLAGTSSHGMKIFSTLTSSYRDLPLAPSGQTGVFVRDFVKYSGDEYWVATESGIFICNISTNKVQNLKKDYSNPYSISDNAVYTFCRDREGGIWAGTYFGGINYYPRQYTNFKKYFPQAGKNSLSGNAIREICMDPSGSLWIGTEDAGLNKLDPSTGRFTHFSPASPKYKISHTNIHALLINGHELWVGTFHQGLDVIDIKTGQRIRHYSESEHFLNSDFICCLIKTRAGRIIAATDRGLCYFDPGRQIFVPIDDIPRTFYTRIYEDQDGTIWAGSYSEGLYYFNPRTGKHGNFRYKRTDTTSLTGNRVNWIFEDSRKALWIATEGGLCRLNKEKQNFSGYSAKDGFPSNIIYAVLEDGDNDFWISTSKGLVHFSPRTGKTETYTKANGLLSDQFNYNSAFKDPHGRLYFGSLRGMIAFRPSDFVKNTFHPPVYITGFQVNNSELEVNKKGSPLTQSVTTARNITLAHDQSTFSINFAALSYTAPDKIEYAYKLEGLDKDWVYLKTNRKVFFTELAPGTYNFMVKGSVGNGIWSGRPAVLTIKVLPPFWKSNWAYLLYIISLSAFAYLILRNYHQRQEEKNKRKLQLLEFEKQKEISQAKIDFFTNVAHEIRTPLTLVKAPMEKVMEKTGDIPSVRDYLTMMERNIDRLIDLTGQLLDFRKIEVNSFSLHFEEADITEILRDQYERFKPAAEERKLTFTLECGTGTAPAEVDVEALTKILSNVLNNAVKYADSKVSIHLMPVTGDDTHITIKIKNDGYLIPAEMKERIFATFYRLKETEKQTGAGIGLALSRSLAELHKGTLELENPEGDLNVFTLKLPIHQRQTETDL